jgi:hypothetical protein
MEAPCRVVWIMFWHAHACLACTSSRACCQMYARCPTTTPFPQLFWLSFHVDHHPWASVSHGHPCWSGAIAVSRHMYNSCCATVLTSLTGWVLRFRLGTWRARCVALCKLLNMLRMLLALNVPPSRGGLTRSRTPLQFCNNYAAIAGAPFGGGISWPKSKCVSPIKHCYEHGGVYGCDIVLALSFMNYDMTPLCAHAFSWQTSQYRPQAVVPP